jgi:hypothetical protein
MTTDRGETAAPPKFTDLGFAEIEVGTEYGPFQETVTAAMCESLGGTAEVVPPEVFPALFLRALRAAMGGIPPGAILAKQGFEQLRPLEPGTGLDIAVAIGDKYEKRGKGYVAIDFILSDGDDAVVKGRKVIVWPDGGGK